MAQPEIHVRLPPTMGGGDSSCDTGDYGVPRMVCLDPQTLGWSSADLTVLALKSYLTSRFDLPGPSELRLTTLGGLPLADGYCPLLADRTLPPSPFWACQVSLPLRGGKGGFGSMLRAQGGKMATHKTTNFDACRDLSGRRLLATKEVDATLRQLDLADELAIKRKDRIRKRIQKGLQEPVEKKHRFDDPHYFAKTETIAQNVKLAVRKAVRQSDKNRQVVEGRSESPSTSPSSSSSSSSLASAASSDAVTTSKATPPTSSESSVSEALSPSLPKTAKTTTPKPTGSPTPTAAGVLSLWDNPSDLDCSSDSDSDTPAS